MGSYAFCCLDLTAKSSKSITFERKYKTSLMAVTHNYVYAGKFTVVMYKSKQTTILYATFIMALSNTQQNGGITMTNINHFVRSLSEVCLLIEHRVIKR